VVVKSNNTYLNILVSYAYLGKSKSFTQNVFDRSKAGDINVMIDSGAFTLFNCKDAKMNWLTLDSYCKFLDAYGNYSEKYVMLDVINKHNESKDNYEVMIKRGLNPMYVFTNFDNDYTYLKQAVQNNKHICVAGGVTSYREWMQKRYQDVYLQTKANIHGLGFVKFPDMYQLNLYSVDSSSWIQGAQAFGKLYFFQEDGLKSILYPQILRDRKAMPKGLIKILDKLKVSPKEFSELSNHRGRLSIASLLSLVANIQYQKYSKERGLDLFLACANSINIDDIVYVDEQLRNNTLTYNGFKNKKTY